MALKLSLVGKRALVGGSSKGIGKAVAIQLAELGASVTLLARSEDLLRLTLGALDSTQGQEHHFMALDYTDLPVLEEVSKRYTSQNPVHILVNNTGGPAAGPAHLALPDTYAIAFRHHLMANQVLVQACVPGMIAAGYGRIINIISTSVKQPLPNLGVSNTIRGAVANWAKTLANELGPRGITVNNVLPGATATERLQAIIESNAQRFGQPVEKVTAEMLAEIPLGRFARPEEIAAAVAFLAAPAASYITGTNMTVDGGRTKSL